MKQFVECPECGKVHLIEQYDQLLCDNCNAITLYDELTPLKAISIHQPWAWLIANGFKDIENRNWKTKFSGTILIHASQKYDEQSYITMVKRSGDKHVYDGLAAMPANKRDFNYGGVVGYCKITACVKESKNPWFFGKYGFEISDANLLPFTPCKDKLSFFYPQID